MSVHISPLPSVTSVTTVAPETGLLGRLFEQDNGNVYKLIVCSGTSLVLYELAQIDISEGNGYSVEISAANADASGVCISAVATDSYGFIQVGGLAECKISNATLAAGAMVLASASGNTIAALSTATDGLRVIGKALDAQGSTGSNSSVYLKGIY